MEKEITTSLAANQFTVAASLNENCGMARALILCHTAITAQLMRIRGQYKRQATRCGRRVQGHAPVFDVVVPPQRANHVGVQRLRVAVRNAATNCRPALEPEVSTASVDVMPRCGRHHGHGECMAQPYGHLHDGELADKVTNGEA